MPLSSVLMHLVFGAVRFEVERDVLALYNNSQDVEHFVVRFGDGGPMVDDLQRAGAKVFVVKQPPIIEAVAIQCSSRSFEESSH